MKGMKSTMPPTQTHHQAFHWPGALAAAVATSLPCALRNSRSAWGTLESAMSLACASAGLTLNVVAISVTALVSAAVSVGLAWRVAWVAGSMACAVASSGEYCADIWATPAP